MQSAPSSDFESPTVSGRPRLLYVVTEDWFFCSHFLDRARVARERGYLVAVAAREGLHREAIQTEGFEFFPIPLGRRNINPVVELTLLFRITRVYKQFCPNVVHQIGAKPILYGAIAARLAGVDRIVNAPIGMGYVFSSDKLLARTLRPFLKLAYKFAIKLTHSKVIFENREDRATFVNWGAVRQGDTVLIPGAGVDLNAFCPSTSNRVVPTIVLTARMLEDKGVCEFVAAARLLRSRGIHARFVLAGAPDPANPTSVSDATLARWHREGWVEYWGWQEDVAGVLRQSDVVCLPSYREGLPKSLIEACACGLPIVTTDTTGCREVVTDGENGFLVPVKSAEPLAAALERLIVDPDLRHRMGAAGRKRAEQLYDTFKIAASTLQVYEDVYKNRSCHDQTG